VQALPGFRPMEVLVDVSFTATFDTGSDFLVALAYLGALLLLGLLARAIVGHR
jgi:hypothetical protein